MQNLDYNFVLNFAAKKHEGQLRADGITPYIEHPIKVAELIKKYKKSRNIDAIVASALLHDTLEDTYTSYRELVDNFGEIVASMVMEVTTASYMPHLVGKGNYLKHKMIDMSNYSLCIKLADRLANLMDAGSLPEERRQRIIFDTYEIIEYLEEKRQLTEAHRALIEAIKVELKKLEQTK